MIKELWTDILGSLETTVNKQSFNMWLKDTEPVTMSDNTIIIKVIDDVTKRHIIDQYLPFISSKIKELTGQNYTCEFVTGNTLSPEKNINISTQTTEAAALNTLVKDQGSQLNPRYTFENFIVGPNNQLAHAAAKAISTSPATQYNPFFIYGGTGLGKTHLMQAIGHQIMDDKPYLKVLYVPSEQFINEFISSIRTNTTASFKIKYRDVDILLIDDIQFIEKKEETQNEFFHTFNTLYENKKQIIISSDRPPKQLQTLEERLRTRFEWGMITDIQPPNLETREAILKNKAEKENIYISDDVLNYIAKRIKSSIRLLEGALTRLSMVQSLYNEEITIAHAKKHLKDFFDDDSSRKVTIHDVMDKVASKFNVTVDDLVSKSRHSRIIQPRFIAMYITRQMTGMTTIEIGKEFGDRDHSTVVNAINNVEENIKIDSDLKEQIDDIIVELKS